MEIPLEVAQFRYVLFHRSVWIEFIIVETENWKHYSKIIFKCINSAVGYIFNIFKCMNSVVAWVNSNFCLYTVNSCDFTVHALKKEKKENHNVEIETRKTRIQTGTYCHIIFLKSILAAPYSSRNFGFIMKLNQLNCGWVRIGKKC